MVPAFPKRGNADRMMVFQHAEEQVQDTKTDVFQQKSTLLVGEGVFSRWESEKLEMKGLSCRDG